MILGDMCCILSVLVFEIINLRLKKTLSRDYLGFVISAVHVPFSTLHGDRVTPASCIVFSC